MLSHFYQKMVIEKPKIILAFLIVCLIGFSFYSKDFKLDASSDTLLLEKPLQHLHHIT